MSNPYKIEAAHRAVAMVEPGMKLGIGTGSTAREFIRLLAEQISAGLDIVGVSTSQNTTDLCHQLGIPLTTLAQCPTLDMTVDGADEIDQTLNLIKGGGGALLREKIVASASKRMLVIADDSKQVDRLGTFALPLAIHRFGWQATIRAIETAIVRTGLKASLVLRGGENNPFITDDGHLIVDASFGFIPDAYQLSVNLLDIPGVVQHGLFLDIADMAIIVGRSGVCVLHHNSHK